MPLVSDQLPNLMNGVSQQALTMRLSSQAERQVNGFSSIVEGVNKRLPLQFLAKIFDGDLGDVHIHTINRDTSERYIVAIRNGEIKVFDLMGNEKTVTYASGTGYITTPTPSKDIRCVTVADYTFIVNTNVPVQKMADTTPTNVNTGYIFIKQVNYDTTYSVYLNGSLAAQYTTADAYGTNPKVSIADVVNQLATQLDANLDASWTITQAAPVIEVKLNSTSGFNLEVFDTNGNSYSSAISTEVQRFTDLPTTFRHDAVVKVSGADDAETNDYWLKFRSHVGGGMTDGVWEETVAPNTEYRLDTTTMPHSLVRMPDGTFQLQQIPWGERIAGDTVLAPWPSFLGRTIRDIYFDRNRLCFLTGGNVVMSRAGDFFSFFPETVLTVLDDGPIDVAATGSKVSILQYAVAFNKNVVIFSDQTQFVIDEADLLASKPPAVKEITAYEIDDGAKPVAVGKTVYFAVKRGLYSSLMEYYVVPETETTDASDVSKHVPTYIPKDVFKITASPTTEIVLMLSREHPNRVYTYKYYWQGDQKMQSAHSYWEFREDSKVLNVDFIGDTAYFLIQYPDGVYIETMDITEGVADERQTFVTRLDRRVNETQVTTSYDAAANRTTITLPYVPSQDINVVTRPPETPIEGFTAYTTADVSSVAGNDVTVVGDYSSVPFFVGEPYDFIYEFSKPVLKVQSQSGGTAAVAAGRLQLSRWHILYANTGYFRAEVQTGNKSKYTYTYSGKTLGTSSATIGEIEPTTGVFSFKVNGKADRTTITIINDSFLPSYLTGAEWEGRFERRSSRI